MENKVDRLFQDKLARHEVVPTPQAWEQVRTELDGKNKPKMWLRIAASVALLAVCTFLIFRSPDSAQMESTSFIITDQPTPLADFQWNLPEIETKVEIKKQPNQAPIRSKQVVRDLVAQIETTEEILENMENTEMFQEVPINVTADKKEAVAIIDEVTPSANNHVLPQFEVQITYKASESDAVVQEEKTRVGKLLDRARQIKPGEMLASIRETKNDFFDGKKN